MKIATAQQMKNIDRRAIGDFGIPGPVLMENAAAAALFEMEKLFYELSYELNNRPDWAFIPMRGLLALLEA